MRFQYSILDNQDAEDGMSRVPIVLKRRNRRIETVALVDSGATVNVLPFSVGKKFGVNWDEKLAVLPLAGILGTNGILLELDFQLGDYPPILLSFAWVKMDRVPVILGQYDFFENFFVSFERYNLEFEITPKPK